MKALLFAAAILGQAVPACAGEIVRTPAASPSAPLSAAVTVPAGFDLVFLSGVVAPPVVGAAAGTPAAFGGDTRAQTVAALTRLKTILSTLGLGFGDVVQAHVFLVGDPAHGGVMDFAGLNSGWAEFFGTAEQPGKPARTTAQVVALAAPGALVEIELVAARPRS
ncbi:MAG: RidA family protein [Caulobacteraceae bacterium]|nr:RidA family protein [Caulobacteraceae bacterium]